MIYFEAILHCLSYLENTLSLFFSPISEKKIVQTLFLNEVFNSAPRKPKKRKMKVCEEKREKQDNNGTSSLKGY